MLPQYHGKGAADSTFVRKIKKRLRYRLQRVMQGDINMKSCLWCLCCFSLVMFLPSLWASADGVDAVQVPEVLPPAIPPAPLLVDTKWEERREAVKQMFLHAWDGYDTYAFGHDEIRPESNITNDSWGGFGVTLIDGLDTMYVMGLDAQFKKAREFVATRLNFEKDYSVSFFETSIRYLGGLLSAYDLSKDTVFLTQATNIGDRLLKAFEESTGIPYHEVNLKTGEAKNPSWNHDSSMLAEMGSVQLEMKYLSHHTGNPIYAEKAQRVMDLLDSMSSSTIDGLFPTYIHAKTGRFNNDKVSFGGLGDSFYEYLLKQWLQTRKTEPQFRRMYDAAMVGMKKHLVQRSGPRKLTFIGEMENGQTSQFFEHLVCFVPGMLALGADGSTKDDDLQLAKELVETCYTLYRDQATGIAPEAVDFNTNPSAPSDYAIRSPRYLLRPETIESMFVLYRITGDEKYREWAWELYLSIEKHCRTPSSYSGLEDVTKDRPGKGWNDSMQSFFLAETLKYLFLIFSDDDVIPLDKYVLTTEGHPLSVLASQGGHGAF